MHYACLNPSKVRLNPVRVGQLPYTRPQLEPRLAYPHLVMCQMGLQSVSSRNKSGNRVPPASLFLRLISKHKKVVERLTEGFLDY